MEKQFQIFESLLIKFMTVLMFLFALSQVNAQTTDLIKKYDKEIKQMNDNDSCSVRLIANYFDISYFLAYDILESYGRENAKGVDIRLFAKAFNTINKDIHISKLYEVNISLRKFIKNVANENESYILVSKNHIYYIDIYNDKKNMLYGNENDRQNKILYYIPIKKNKNN